jgi:MraZ protein
MFRGSHLTRIDEKFRLKVPAEFKRRIDEVYGPKFYITSKDGKRAELIPLKEWEKIEEKMAKISPLNPAKKRFLDITGYYGQMVEMDQQGRLLLPQKIREAAALNEEVIVIGMQTSLDVENHERFKPAVVPLTDAELLALAELGM